MDDQRDSPPAYDEKVADPLRKLEDPVIKPEKLLAALEPPNAYPPPTRRTNSPSDFSGTDIPSKLECTLCTRRNIRVQFSECAHAACSSCVKGLWRGRKRHVDHFPMSFLCPWCGMNITRVGELSVKRKRLREFLGLGDEVWHGDFVFMVWEWELVKAWIARSSRVDGLAMRRNRMRNIREAVTRNPLALV